MDKNMLERLKTESGKSIRTIYYWCQKLGRVPTVEELKAIKQGRPQKYK